MSDNLLMLCGAAATMGVIHTLLGPDHYLPFVAMSRAGAWSLRRTLAVAFFCGLGHVLSSVALGVVGIAAGVALFRMEAIETVRGELAGWMLLGFGLVYFVYGVRRAIRHRPHAHWHAHADGTVHQHEHVHVDQHVHIHLRDARAKRNPHTGRAVDASTTERTPWIMFTILVFGPCEPLIPFLMYPASKGNWMDVAVVTTVFGLATLATMTVAVALSCLAMSAVAWPRLERFGHALAGFVVLFCGAAIKFGL